ncbi:protein transport protein Sec23p [[Candida] railenensis]|uniref:Protein transport protein SEC23 n=1 Tax=[Candida] railenensis TaxID=45579 RepID=A0A9P0VY81_9ASCO|nr:protein transport protein Sec23p [[Candida] railenensis]
MSSGINFNWDVFPSTRLENSQLPTPIGCLYQPLIEVSKNDNQSRPSAASFCSCQKCGAYMNPYIEIDHTRSIWKCQFCHQKSFLPKVSSGPISNDSLPAFAEQTISNDITTGFNGDVPESIVLVVDLYQHVDEVQEDGSNTSFSSLIESLLTAMDRIKDGSLLALISFDESVHIHRPATPNEKTSFAKDELFEEDAYNVNDLFENEDTIAKVVSRIEQSGVGDLPKSVSESPLVSQGILVELSDATRDSVKSHLRSLKPTFTNSFKPPRSLGLCLYISSLLVSRLSFQNFKAKFLIFVSGPNTTEPGIILNPNKNKVFRSHSDIKELNDKSSNYSSSLKFFEMISFIANGLSLSKAFRISSEITTKTTDFELNLSTPKWSFDIFTGSLDQVGLYEMKRLIQNTNGDIFVSSSFKDLQFRNQLVKCFEAHTKSYNATLTVLTSPRLKVRKLVGHCYHLPASYKDSKSLQENISDQLNTFDSKFKQHYFTNRWFWNSFKKTDESLAIFFDIDGLRSFKDFSSRDPKNMYVQFQFKYWDPEVKLWKIRITTVCKRTTLSVIDKQRELSANLINAKIDMLQSFNAKSWTVLLARLMINKLDTNIGFDFEGIVEEIDSVTVKLLNNFNKLIVENYQINENLKDLPSFIYNLRRNPQLINIFNSSPDETTYYHHWFMKMGQDLGIKVIEPLLYSTEYEKTFPLDTSTLSVVPDKSYLIMDSFFNVIVYYKYTAPEDKLKLHHSNNDNLVSNEEIAELKVAKDYLQIVLNVQERSLVPKYIITQTNHSQARFLMSRLNPVGENTYVPPISDTDDSNSSWFQSFFSPKPKAAPASYNVLSDESSFHDYYQDILNRIKNYKLENS